MLSIALRIPVSRRLRSPAYDYSLTLGGFYNTFLLNPTLLLEGYADLSKTIILSVFPINIRQFFPSVSGDSFFMVWRHIKIATPLLALHVQIDTNGFSCRNALSPPSFFEWV